MSERRAWTLTAAAVLAAVETSALIVVVAWRGGRMAPLVVPMVAVKYPFCFLVRRRRHGAWFGLLLWEMAGMLAAVTARRTPLPVRLVEALVAAVVIGLLAAAAPLFPTVRLPDESQAD